MNFELTAATRDKSGKGPARAVRREQKVPAILYGPKTAPMSLCVSAPQLEKLLRETGGESKLLNLNIEGSNARQVLIREIQIHPYRRRFLHVDFYEVPLDQQIEVEVIVELVGDAIGVQKGGELNLIQRTLTVRCLPNQIPESIPVSVTKLDLGQILHVQDLVAQASYEFVDDPNMGVVSVLAPEAAAPSEEEEKK
ncbi:MAG: 50S ribosomal protein L25/general stress protein Ctc [Desulfobacteraceae bacterium]|nr:50S ribosomal protein L25/general stress protein Ctc [Desulfobacteraceae bacterium]